MARGFSRRGGGRARGASTYGQRTQSRPGLTVSNQNSGVNFGILSRRMTTSPKIRARTVGSKAWKQSTQMHRPKFAKPVIASVANGSTQNARRGF